MPRQLFRNIKRRFSRRYDDIDPEDIFIDAANLPGFSEHRMEGRIEKPMDSATFTAVKVVLVCLVLLLGYKLWVISVKDGALYAQISEKNRLSQTIVFANRGVIYDRNGIELATNAIKEDQGDFAERIYTKEYQGLAHLVGYVKYPLKDTAGFYYEINYRGRDGAERTYDHLLSGANGLKLLETDAVGRVTSQSIIAKPTDGLALELAVDARVNNVMAQALEEIVTERKFSGGAGVIMDVETGEIIAMTSFPEYDQNLITRGNDAAAVSAAFGDSAKPFLNRVVGGVYSPGSIIKPVVALAALNENVISPSKKILSTGSITIPNPYDPSKPSIFRDWQAHGWTDMREAIAVSSDVYFYSIGGGFGDQRGLGIDRIHRYLSLFGLTEKTGIDLLGENSGTIPNPEWKKATFDGDIWRLGDTYITSIGQFGSLVTPIESARMIAAVANGGKFLMPSILKGGAAPPNKRVTRTADFSDADWLVVREGMRGAVTYGTAGSLNVPYVKVAAKTGTAEVGTTKRLVHSWSVGYFPYDKPKYAFVVLMENGPSTNTVGASHIMRRVLDWMLYNAPEYFE
jgi:penicillin-binding protein 2